MKTISEILISMGYREIATGKWAKPVGFQLLTYEETKQLFTNWFKSRATEEILIWNDETYKKKDGCFLSWLQSVEYLTDLRRECPNNKDTSGFEFTTLKESIEQLL